MPLCAECRRDVDAVELSRFAASPRCRACQKAARTRILFTRLTEAEYAALARVAASRQVRVSRFVRQVMRAVVAKVEGQRS